MDNFKRTNILFTSDWHLEHKNVLEYDKRPFSNLEEMHRVLINNYNASATDTTVGYFLGDVGMGGKISHHIKKLKGTKVLILGNHDKNTYSMYAQGFDVVLNGATIYIGDKRVSMNHCPLPGIFREDITNMKGAKPGENWHGEFKQKRFTSQDLTVDYHLHGHCHKKPEERETNRQFDVGVRANGYRPVSMSQIESWISRMEKKKNETTRS